MSPLERAKKIRRKKSPKPRWSRRWRWENIEEKIAKIEEKTLGSRTPARYTSSHKEEGWKRAPGWKYKVE